MERFSKQRSSLMGDGGKETEDKTETGSSARSPEFADFSARFMADQAAMFSMMTAFGMQMAGAWMGAVASAADKKKDAAAPSGAAVEPEPVKPEAPPVKSAKVVPLTRGKKKAAPQTLDDLKRISGIGPRLEKVLNGMGVRSFADIAKWSDEDVLKMDETLGLDNRIVRDEWVTKAKALLEG
jgi:NADH-quinone oxidoreductase subunit E